MSKAKIVNVSLITGNRQVVTIREGVSTHYDVQDTDGKVVATGFTSHERAVYYIENETNERTRFDKE
jgi:cytoskeletal protein RodZ